MVWCDAVPADLDVFAMGNALVDIEAEASEERLAEVGIAKSTMALVDLDASNRLVAASRVVRRASGGSAANTAVGVAALGGRAAFVGTVADDELGRAFRADLEQAGVVFARVDAQGSSASLPTGRCLVLVTPDGERTMATYIGAAGELGPQDVDLDALCSSRIVYLEGYLFDFPSAAEAMKAAIEAGHSAGALLALSASDPSLVERHQGILRRILEEDVDLLFANEAEALVLSKTSSVDAAARFVADVGVVGCITLGDEGVLVVTPSGISKVPACFVEPVLDTTGAGDLFAAGFLFGMARGADPETSAAIGCVCAAEVVSHFGARPEADIADLVAKAGLMPG